MELYDYNYLETNSLYRGIIENFKDGVSKNRINIEQGFGGAAPDTDKLHLHVNFIHILK